MSSPSLDEFPFPQLPKPKNQSKQNNTSVEGQGRVEHRFDHFDCNRDQYITNPNNALL